MPAPWEMTYGPYWEQEQRRRESSRRALGMPAISPSQVAAETYGMEQARLGEKRAFTQQFINNYFRNQEIKRAKDAQSQQTTTEAVKGVDSLALGGYKLGKEVGLWGAEKGVSTVNNVAGLGPSSVAETGLTTAGQAMPESLPGGAMQALPEATSGAMEAIPGTISTVGEAIPAITTGGEVAGAALGAETAAIAGAGAITETALPAIPVVAGVVEGAMGTGVAATTAASAVAAESGVFATILPSLSVLGPVGWAVGAVATIASLIFGDELGKIFG